MSNEVSSAVNFLEGSSFLQRIIELNLSDPRNPERIVYPLYVIATVLLLARLSGYENSREKVLLCFFILRGNAPFASIFRKYSLEISL